MSEEYVRNPQQLDAWLTGWLAARREIEELIASRSERNPTLYFEPTLAELELQDISEAVQRAAALTRLLRSDDLMTSAELQATGNV